MVPITLTAAEGSLVNGELWLLALSDFTVFRSSPVVPGITRAWVDSSLGSEKYCVENVF